MYLPIIIKIAYFIAIYIYIFSLLLIKVYISHTRKINHIVNNIKATSYT